jgi:hypothetical protein
MSTPSTLPRLPALFRTFFGTALLAAAALCGSANAELRLQIPEQTFGPPFYARIEFAAVDPAIVPHNGEWAAIVIYRQFDCIPADFNLLEVFDVPAAFGCPLNDISGYEVWMNAPGVDPAPTASRLRGESSVPVLFVRHAEFLDAIADAVLTMPELLALPSARMGLAEQYDELMRPSQSNAEPLLHITAQGRFEDGGGFRLRWTLSRPPGADANVSRTRIELLGADVPLGAILQPFPFGGAWYDRTVPGQGLTLLPVPGMDRLVGSWMTYADGQPAWYQIVTGNDGFDGLRADFTVLRSSGGELNQAQPFELHPIGELRIDFAGCGRARAQYQLGEASGSMELQMLLAAESCTE